MAWDGMGLLRLPRRIELFYAIQSGIFIGKMVMNHGKKLDLESVRVVESIVTKLL